MGDIEDISDDLSVVSLIPDIPEINRPMQYQYSKDFLIVGPSDFDWRDGEALVLTKGNSPEFGPLDDRFHSSIATNPLVANDTLNDTEALTSLEFLYHETFLNHALTYIHMSGIFDQVTSNGVWGFFITVVRFIYGLYRLNFFFL